MKRFLLILFCAAIASGLWGVNADAQKVQPVDRLNHSGDIQGIVECPPGTPVSGAMVYIAGHSFMARTDGSGSFRLYNVPEGMYDLAVEAASGSAVTFSGVTVRAKRVAYLGTILACSTSCNDNSGCPEGYYCAKAEGDCEGAGVCTQKPTVWIEIYAPVCGCDGKTYGNEGEAAGAGVNIAYRGECDNPEDTCFNDRDCSKGEYCAKTAGNCDGSGTCQEIPGTIPCPMIYAPVCGCDGKTYSNSCVALGAAVNVDYEGPCRNER